MAGEPAGEPVEIAEAEGLVDEPDIWDDPDARPPRLNEPLTVLVSLDVTDGFEADGFESEVEAEASAEERDPS